MAIGIAIGIGFGNNPSLSQDAQDWQARIIANGGTIPAATLKIFDDNFFKPAKANGLILSELDRLNVYCGLVGFEIAARTNLIKSAHYVTPVSSPIFDNNGYRSGGTGYLNLNYTQSTEAIKLTQNSAAIGCVVKTPSYATLTRMMGANSSTNRATAIGRLTSPAMFGLINTIDGAIASSNAPTTGNVFFEAVRSNSTNLNVLANGVNTSGAQNSNATIINISAFELTLNNAGTPLSGYDTNSHLASWHGSSTLDNATLRTILTNLFTALGV